MQTTENIICQNLSLIFRERLTLSQIGEMIKKNLANLERRRVFLKQLSVMKLEEIERFVPETEGEDNLKRALDSGKGIILLSMHFFCCDLGLIWLSHRGFKMNLLYDFTEDAREGLSLLENTFEGKGINLIKSARSFKIRIKDKEFIFRDNTLKKITAILNNNEVLAMLPDIHPGSKTKGVYVKFLGRPTYVSYAPILIAQRTGAKMVPALVVPTEEGSFRGIIHPPLSLIRNKDKNEFYKVNMQQYMDIVESYVSKYPEEYFWHQPSRWANDN